MNRIKAIIIDDEPPAALRLADMVEKYCSPLVKLAGLFHSMPAGIAAIKGLQPELVFLDVQIHDKTGFELLEQFSSKNFEVIFVTAYEKYAVQAFKFSAVDYLLKPVERQDLIRAVEKAAYKKPGNTSANHFQVLLENIAQIKQYTPPKKIIVPTLSGFQLLPVIDILRCESDVNYTTIYMQSGEKLVVAKTLKEFEEMLSEYNFFRIHNSHLVNLAYVKSYQKGKGGSVTLINGTELEVSQRRKDDFLEKLGKT